LANQSDRLNYFGRRSAAALAPQNELKHINVAFATFDLRDETLAFAETVGELYLRQTGCAPSVCQELAKQIISMVI
jgi:soluble lytic murein transglycosylase-like protein